MWSHPGSAQLKLGSAMAAAERSGAATWWWLLGLLVVIGVGVTLIWVLVMRPADEDSGTVPSPANPEQLRDPDAEQFATRGP